nr:hypothetical protein [Tanacetum cinerariifolium]
MELESIKTSTTAKLPMLKQGDYETWRLRIEQYFQTTTNDDGTSTTFIPGPVTTKEKDQKKNDIKARKTRFSSNEATKKTLSESSKATNTHVVVWRNKFDLDTININDLYNNFKIVEQEVKGTSCSNLSSQNMAFVTSPSPSSTNEVPTAYGVSTASTQSSTANIKVSTANLSDATVNRFEVENSTIKHEGKEVFPKKTERKTTNNGNDTAGFDKSKVECYNCHKMGHFSRECRQPRNQESRSWNQDSSRRTVNVEETPPKAMVAIDGVGFDWSYMAEDEVPTNMTLITFLDSEESTEVKESSDVPLVKKLVSDDKLEKQNVVPTDAKIEFVKAKQQEKPVRKPVKYAEMYRSQGQIRLMLLRPQHVRFGDLPNLMGHPQQVQKDQGYVDSGCSRHMIGNLSYLSDFKEFNGGYVTFGEEQMVAEILVKELFTLDNLVRGLPSKHFENDQTCVACLKGKQHKASSTKDETSGILKKFITEIETLVDKKVKVIRCDNGTKFKNSVMNDFCAMKGIRREFSVARTPRQNGVAERRNRTLIEAARTMLADSKLITTFWAEAVNTACYVQNRVLVAKPHNKTPYELFRVRLLEYTTLEQEKVEENLHIRFLEDKPSIVGNGPKWLFDIEVLKNSMSYVPVIADTNSNDFIGTKETICKGHSRKEIGSSQDYILMPLWKDGSLFDSSSKNATNDEPQSSCDAGNKDDNGVNKDSGIDAHEKYANSIIDVNTVRSSINTASADFDTRSLNINTVSLIVSTASPEATYANFLGDKTERDMSNINTTYQGYTQEEDIDYKEVFAFVARIEAIRLFLAYASFMGFMVYQMDVKSAFLYGRIEEKEYVCQPPGFEDLAHPDKVYKVVKVLYGLHQAPKASQDKYVTEVLRKFNLSDVKTASTPVDIEKPLVKDADDFKSHLRSPTYMLSKEFLDTLKDTLNLAFGILEILLFELVAYTDSDYVGSSLDRKSTSEIVSFWEADCYHGSARSKLWLLLLQLSLNMWLLLVVMDKYSGFRIK